MMTHTEELFSTDNITYVWPRSMSHSNKLLTVKGNCMSSISYLPAIQKILKLLPDFDKNGSIGELLFNTLYKAPEQGQNIAELGECAIDEAISMYTSCGIYRRAAIINACTGFIENEVLGDKILKFFTHVIEQDESILQESVLKALGESGSPKSLPIVKQCLKDPDAMIACTAASAFAMIDPVAAMAAVMSGKRGRVEEKELLELIDDLCHSKQKISELQIGVLLACEYPSVRLETLLKLVAKGRLSNAQLTELLKDSSAAVRSKALQLLVAQAKDENLSELLITSLYDKDRTVVDTARKLLTRSRQKQIPRLLEAAEKAKGYTLDAMISLLMDVKAPQLIPKFGEALKKGMGRKQMRVSIIKWLLVQGRSAEIMRYFEFALLDSTQEVVDAALHALTKIGDEEAERILSNYLLTIRHGRPAEQVMETLSHFSVSVFETAIIRFLEQVNDAHLLWSVMKIVKRHHLVSTLPKLHKMRATAPADHQEYLDEAIELLEGQDVDACDIERSTQRAQVSDLIYQRVQTESIETSFDGTRDELIIALEDLLDEKTHFGWQSVFEQLKMLDWRPAVPRYVALLAADEEDPRVPMLDEESARWIGDFVSMSQDAHQVTRMLRVLARGGDQCKSTLLELITNGHLGLFGETATDMLRCFTREEVVCMLESDNLEQSEFALQVVGNGDWPDKKDLIESRLRLALSNSEDRIVRSATSLLYETNPKTVMQLILNALAANSQALSFVTQRYFVQLLGEMDSNEARLMLIGQLMKNQTCVSKAAYQALVKKGWSPSTAAEKALQALYKPEPQVFETLGEEVLPLVLTFLQGREKCDHSIISYLLRVVPKQRVDETLIRTVLEGNWDYKATQVLPKLLAINPDIATDVLLELITEQLEGSASRIDYAEYISAVGNKRAITLFLSFLNSTSEFEIKLGAKALGRLKHAAAVPLLGAVLPNIRDKATYSAIVKAIAAIGGEEAVGLLRPLLPELQTKVLRSTVEKAIATWEKTHKK
ncbi:MAG: hypothetical protein N0E44_23190 [Candidatus Thiodiazotropha lotti]|nr:hypothetical protein [Candidatus Thiodiazotropha lotti]MCW4222775.1 hypothetical protein [Candidatus Thiodiazotropha lotti]